MRLLCWLGFHPFRVMQFVGSSWNPDMYVEVCRFCGEEPR